MTLEPGGLGAGLDGPQTGPPDLTLHITPLDDLQFAVRKSRSSVLSHWTFFKERLTCKVNQKRA